MATGYQGYQGYGDPARAKVDRARQVAELLQQGATDTSPKSFWEGAAQLGKAFIARSANERADAAESSYATNRARRIAQFLNPNADAEGRNMAPDVNVSAEPAPAAQADPRIRAIASALGGVYEGDGKTQPTGMTAAPMADVGAPQMLAAPAPAAPPMRPAQPASQPAPTQDRTAWLQRAMQITGGDLGQATALVEARLGPAPKPKEYGFSEVNNGLVRTDPITGEASYVIDPVTKPDVVKAPTVNQFGQQWDEAKGQWVTIPGAMDNYGRMHPEKPAGAGPQLTPYQQHQIDRADQADKEKKTAADEQRRVLLGGLDDSITRIDSLINSKGFNGLYGPIGAFGLNMGAKPTNMMNQDELNANALLDQIGGEAFLAGVAKMRGAGAVSENEGKKVMAAVQHLTNRLQSPEAARAAAIEFQQSLRALKEAYTREGGGSATPPPPQQPNMLDQIGGAVGGFMQNMMGGNRRPAPAQDDVSDLLKKYGQ